MTRELSQAASEGELTAIARALSGVIYAPSSSIAGRVEGQSLTYRLTARGAGSTREPWTEIEVQVEASAIELDLRIQDEREERMVKRGEALDLSLDDARFDRTFIVEGAPTEAIRKWLKAELRATLLGLAPVHVALQGKLLTLGKPSWVLAPDAARALAEATAALAREYARVVVGRRDDALASASAKREGYRDALSPSEARIALERTEGTERREIARLHEVRGNRDAGNRALVIGLLAFAIAVVALGVLFAYALR